MKKRLTQAALALLITLGVTLAVTTPAYASFGGCPTGALCTYWDSNGNGAVYYYTYPGDQRCVDIGEPWNDDISSVWNNTGTYPYDGHHVVMYRDKNCANSFYSYTWGQQDKNTVCSLWCFPDAYSSLRWCNGPLNGC